MTKHDDPASTVDNAYVESRNNMIDQIISDDLTTSESDE